MPILDEDTSIHFNLSRVNRLSNWLLSWTSVVSEDMDESSTAAEDLDRNSGRNLHDSPKLTNSDGH